MTETDHKEIMDAIAALSIKINIANEKLDPIYQTYQAWLYLGRWGKAIIYVAGLVLGILVAWKNLIHK